MFIGIGIGIPLGSTMGAGGGGLLSQATTYLGGVAPYHWFDFINDRALFAGADVGALASTPGWSFSRASTGYAENVDGTLTSFASGALRRTDKGVLIEGARTNLCLRSQEFDNASWTKVNSSVSANSAVAPDGTTTADSLIPDSAASVVHTLRQDITIVADAVYAVSAYFKKGTGSLNHAYIRLTDQVAHSGNVFANISTGVLGTVAAAVGSPTVTGSISALANGWYRLVMVIDFPAGSATTGRLEIGITNADNAQAYTSNGTDFNYVWQAQLEAGSFVSSPIVTTSASATRAADVLTVSSPGVSYPLSLFAEFERAVDAGARQAVLTLDTGSTSDRVNLTVDSSDLAETIVASGGVTQAQLTVSGGVALAPFKTACRATTNDVQMAKSGTLGTADTLSTNPASPTTLLFGIRTGSTDPAFGYLRKAAIFNSAVNDAGLTGMTT